MAAAVVKTLAEVAETAGDLGVPYIGGVAGVVQAITESAEKVAIHKDECRNLSAKALELYLAFEMQRCRLEGSALQEHADDVEQTLKTVHDRMTRITQYGRVSAFLKDAKILKKIRTCNRLLDNAIKKFNVHAAIVADDGIRQANVSMVEMRGEMKQLFEELREQLVTDPRRAVRRMRTLQADDQGYVAGLLMEDAQLRLRDLREHQPEQPRLVHKGGNATVQLTNSAGYLRIQHGMYELHKETGTIPVMKHLEGEISNVDNIPTVGGLRTDIWIGWWLGDVKVALKAFRKIQVTSSVTAKVEEYLKTSSKISHPHILSFLGLVARSGLDLKLVRVWQDNGNIIEFVRAFPDADRHRLLREAAEGLAYLHQEETIHGNMKCDNILISSSQHALVCDYGISVLMDQLSEFDDNTSSSISGAHERWYAPELLGLESDAVDYPTKSCDVYSFGMTMLECYSVRIPFYGLKRNAQVTHKLFSNDPLPPRPDTPRTMRWITDEVWTLMRACWERDPNERPSMDEVVGRMSSSQSNRHLNHRDDDD